MATNYGPKYPCIEDGLVFCFDPKNRNCWDGGNTFSDLVKNASLDASADFEGDEMANALTTAGYVDMDGTDDAIDCGQIAALKGASSWTISGWYNQTTLDQQRFLWGTFSSGTNMISAETWNDGQMYFEIRNGGSSYAQFDYSTVISAGTWFHIAMIFDGTESSDNDRLIAFINGSQVSLNYSAAAIPTTSNATQGNLWIANNTNWNVEWLGGIGPVYIYNRPLSAGEVLTNYNKLKGRFGL